MSDTKPYIVNEIIKNAKYYSSAWTTIGRYFLLFPLAINLVGSKSINDGIKAFVSYPVGIVSFGLLGGLFGGGIIVKQYKNEVTQF